MLEQSAGTPPGTVADRTMPIGKTDHRPKPKSMRAAGTAASALWRRYSWFESMRGSHPFFSEENGSQSRFEITSKHVLKVCCSTVKTPKKVISAWKKCYRVLQDCRVKASWYETRKCWRVLVPPSDSDTGRRISATFFTQRRCREIHCCASQDRFGGPRRPLVGRTTRSRAHPTG